MNINPSVTLVGDSIENPANALLMVHAAQMFGAACRFRDTKGLAQSSVGEAISLTNSAEVKAAHSQIIAFDNLPGARDLYGFHADRNFALLVGNERRGLSHEFTSVATDGVQLPMISRRVNCLNVAAASAVALYYLSKSPVGTMAVRKDPRSRRPDLLLLAPGDHFELGSTIRSAAGLGWERTFIEDPHQAWFSCDRGVRAEGRAAARRGKNEILLIPCGSGTTYNYARVTIVTCKLSGVPLQRVNLAGGPRQVVVIPDESRTESVAEEWTRFGAKVEFAQVQLPRADFTYHYRLMATIALAEISRQVGRPPAGKGPPAPRPPTYDHTVGDLAEMKGEIVCFDDLLSY